TDLHSDSEPAWSPDGTKIAFTSNRDGDTEIFVMNADGSGQTQLTHNDLTLLGAVIQFEVGHDEEPAWSPDGTKIAFISDRPPANRFQLFTMNADGSGQAALGAAAAQMRGPSWAPGGTRIAVATGGFAGDGIYLASAATGALTSLANAVTWDTAPAFSPDGTKIVYRSTFNPNGTGLYTMDADGTGIARLTLGKDYDPDWQPCATCAPPVPKAPPAGTTGNTGGGTTGSPSGTTASVPTRTGRTVNGKPIDNPLSVFKDPLANGGAVADTAAGKAPAELQIWLLRYGLAKLDPSAGRRFKQFPQYWLAQQRAKKAHKGVWGGCQLQAPLSARNIPIRTARVGVPTERAPGPTAGPG